MSPSVPVPPLADTAPSSCSTSTSTITPPPAAAARTRTRHPLPLSPPSSCMRRSLFPVLLLLLSESTIRSAAAADLWHSALEGAYHDKGWYPDEGPAGPGLQPDLAAAAAAARAQPSSSGRRLQELVPMPTLRYAAAYHAAEAGNKNKSRLAEFDHRTSQLEKGAAGPEGSSRSSSSNSSGSIRRRCRHTRGKWCGRFLVQPALPWKSAPRGRQQCSNACNGVGNCNYDIGKCDCPAGWTGDDCTKPDKRPCSNGPRDPNSTQPQSHIDKEGRDLDWLAPGWSASRCAGICDDDLAMCWCDGEGKYRRIPAPPGSPPGTPPLQRGRPLSEFCGKLKEDKSGQKTSWGNVPYSMVYGPGSWCDSEKPTATQRCDTCQVDNLDGEFCDVVKEAFCVGQCSGHGDCNLGFCKCHKGWYGQDCSRKVAGAVMEAGATEEGAKEPKPWLRSPGLGQLPPAARPEPPSGVTRQRPLIYVYDSPPPYTTRMLQYRLVWKSCIWRNFNAANESKLHDWLYGVETYFHEQLLGSVHRTFDPEEADFFYVPLYVTCYFWPIIGWADHPWWHAPEGLFRPMHGANMMLELKRWLESAFPYWKRRGGRDHIWLTAADEGACWMPSEIYNTSIILTHWGRMDEKHESGSAFYRDVYHLAYETDKYKQYQPTDWRELYQGHACYSPRKDLVIPSLKHPMHYQASPLLGAEPYHRDILLFFKGDVGAPPREPKYSRGIRQAVYEAQLQGHWRELHSIYILGPQETVQGHLGYSHLLARSVFCLVAPGDGWSARAEDAILHGCLPLIIMDGVHSVFESILDWDTFSVRIREESIPYIPAILGAISEEQVVRMQRRLSEVWHRFAYTSGTLMQGEVKSHMERNLNFQAGTQGAPLPDTYPIHKVQEYPFRDDAFGTIMQWLHSRIPDTRRGPTPAS